MSATILTEAATEDELAAARGPFDQWAAIREARKLLGLKPDRALPGDESDTLRSLGERRAHVELKKRVAELARAGGWQPTLEAAGDGFRADVLLERDGRRLVVEVQLSGTPLSEYRRRQKRYLAAGLDALWLVGSYPERATPEAALPLFRVGWTDASSEPNLGLPESEPFCRRGRLVDVRALPLAEALPALLEGRIRFAAEARVQPGVELIGWRPDCWRCGAEGSAWQTRQVGRTICGLPHEREIDLDDDADDTFSPQARALARAGGLSDATVRIRYSRTANASYMSFGCASCDALFGDWFIRGQYLDAVYDPPIYALDELGDPVAVERPHWCTGDTLGCFCT